MNMKEWVAAGRRRALGLQKYRPVAAGLSLLREARPMPPPFPPGTPHYDPDLGLFTFRGTYREMGRQFAEALPLADLLERSRVCLRAREETRREVGRAADLLDAWHPQMRAWLEGIVDGHRGYTVDDAVLAAFCTVLMTDCDVPRSCSAIAFNRRGCPILGQNLDLGRRCRLALIRILPASGRAVLARAIAGYPWILAIANDAGLVAGGSSINVDETPRADGGLLPQELLAHVILSRSSTVEEGVALVARLPPLGPLDGGVSLILADRTGDIRHLEITGAKWVANAQADGVSLTTNHFRHPDMAPLDRADGWMGERLLQNSRARYERARTLFAGGENADHAGVAGLLRTDGGGGAWRRTARWPDLGYTTASYIVDGHDRTIEYWIGAGASTARRAALDDLLR